MHHEEPDDSGGRPIAVMVAFTGISVAMIYVIADRIIEDVLQIESAWGQVGEISLMASVTCAVLWAAILRPLHHQATIQGNAAEQHRRAIELSAWNHQFEGQLHRALEMSTTEDVVYRSTGKALRTALEHVDAVMLVADSSRAHLGAAVSTSDSLSGCGVPAPYDCPAIRRSQTLRFESSSALDACPHLDDHPAGACSAVCVPMSVGGRSIGVLHAVGPDQQLPSASDVARLESIATQTGARIGMIRVMAATTLQAATDPLTGLLNRRSLENEVHALLGRGRSFSLAMGDLDHFKRLNDTHGHDAGDRALRLFARVARSIARADDLICRFGGEEFVVVLPGDTAPEAALALRRLQQALVAELAESAVPDFTISFGVTDTTQATTLDELCRIADNALFRAKREGGRDCVFTDAGNAEIVDRPLASPSHDDPVAMADRR